MNTTSNIPNIHISPIIPNVYTTKIIVQNEYYSAKQTTNNPNTLYVFGDNCQRFGKGGQAKIRSCPNTFGIRTKRYPGTNMEDYFYDCDEHKQIIITDCKNLRELYIMNVYDNIVFPKDGLGTGLSQLPQKAPETFKLLCSLLKEYFNINLTEKGFIL